jgi:alpha-N-arabinofuranosidase
MHQYYGNPTDDTRDYLSKSEDMDAFIKSTAAICDVVKAKKHSDKTVNLSFDEWNVWFHSIPSDDKMERWQVAPPLLEDVYTFEDALLVGSMLMKLQNNCDRVKMACIAQLVNVIAPIMTQTGGKAWAQTIFYPFLYASVYGNGTALKPIVRCDTYSTRDHTDVPYLTSSVVYNPDAGEVVVYAVNRSLEEDVELDICLQDFEEVSLKEHIVLHHENLKAVNTAGQENVAPCNVDISREKVVLKKQSWNMLRYCCR